MINELRPTGFEISHVKLNLLTARIPKSSIAKEPFHFDVLLTKEVSDNQSSYYSPFVD